jgi:hypothetical protein
MSSPLRDGRYRASLLVTNDCFGSIGDVGVPQSNCPLGASSGSGDELEIGLAPMIHEESTNWEPIPTASVEKSDPKFERSKSRVEESPWLKGRRLSICAGHPIGRL